MSLLVRTSLALALSSLFAISAHASDGFVPRTPVLWEDVPCAERVDRSRDPVMHLPYGIPNEDTELTRDEVEGSRMHQFFAFCRRKHPIEHLPNWISWADVDAAVEAGLLESADIVEPEDVLESSVAWEGCWTRVTDDDERRPIEFAMADAGVDWDTSEVDPGAYTIYGYTYHPPLNPWFIRPGVVKVHDADPDAAGPAAATYLRDQPDVLVYNGATVLVEGCVDSAEPATVSGYYALGEVDPSWVPFSEGQTVDGDSFALELVTGDEHAGKTSIIRIDFEDHAGRKHTTYMDEVVIVLEGTDPNDCREDGGFISNPDCDDAGESTGGSETGGPSSASETGATSADDTESGPPGQDDGGKGCSCTSPIGAPGASIVGVLALLAWRRRGSPLTVR